MESLLRMLDKRNRYLCHGLSGWRSENEEIQSFTPYSITGGSSAAQSPHNCSLCGALKFIFSPKPLHVIYTKNREAFYVLGGLANDFGIRWQMAWIGCFSFFSFHRNSTFSFFIIFLIALPGGFCFVFSQNPWLLTVRCTRRAS